ncbi:MAG: bifunctional sterol desaturase/short chain dehydrogenase [Leptolyngbya sp. SIOISBB]|nr:bifunctional sterol desaturase/short chain dehydrogenase [Leptolyngbya sp. SIOISBB]
MRDILMLTLPGCLRDYRVMGKPLSFENKVVAVTGASGTMGRALMAELLSQGAKLIALTTSPQANFPTEIRVLPWQSGQEAELQSLFRDVDILIINHGINVHGERTAAAITKSLEINSLSVLALMDAFLAVHENSTGKEIWVNTSEAEVGPALSPLYEISKRLIGDLITLKRQDAPWTIRKIILGPFKSNLNPVGVMSAERVAKGVIARAKRDRRNIIVTINPLTFLAFPLKETAQSFYFRLFSRSPQS